MEEGKVMPKRKDFTVHTSYPTDIEKHYVNILTPAQRLAALVEAGRKQRGADMKQLYGVIVNHMVYYDSTKNAYKYQDISEQIFWVDGDTYAEAERAMIRDFEDAGLVYEAAIVKTDHEMLTAWSSDMNGVSKA